MGGNMKKYLHLTQQQAMAVNSLGHFFEPSQASSLPPIAKKAEKDNAVSDKYVPATDLLTDAQKKKLEERDKKIEDGFKKYSAY